MILGHHHVGFTVSDLKQAEDFFKKVLGFKRVAGGRYDFPYISRQVGYPDAILEIAILTPDGEPVQTASSIVELIEYLNPRCEPTDTATCRPGSTHLCFLVDNIHAEYERMLALGVEFNSSPNEVTHGANKGMFAVYFKGPDHIRLEMIQRARRQDLPNSR